MTSLRRAVLLPAALVGLFYTGAAVWPVLTGWAWTWSAEDVSLPEAVAGRDHAEVVRLLRAGADPNTRAPMRLVFGDGRVVRATPLEAAVGARDEEVVGILLRYGAAPQKPRSACCTAWPIGAAWTPRSPRHCLRYRLGRRRARGITLPW